MDKNSSSLPTAPEQRLSDLPSEALSRFTAKASSELIAVVFIVIADLFFVYKMATVFSNFASHTSIFTWVISLVQMLVFLLCLRILYQDLVGLYEKLKMDLLRLVQPTRPPK